MFFIGTQCISLPRWKVHLVGYNSVTTIWVRVYLRSFIRCCLVNLQNKSKLWENSNLRSSKDIDLGANQKLIYSFLLVTGWLAVVTLDVSRTVSEIMTQKIKNSLFSHHSLVWRPRSEPDRISGWNLSCKNYRVGYCIVKIAQSYLQPCDGKTVHCAYSALCMYAVAW